jgi:MoaA/NifB/PqqE/SkfB family radical SAM enzyme
MQTAHYKSLNGIRAVRRWAIPYFNSLFHSGQFRPILCYLFTEWHCNIDCHYCFQYDNAKQHAAPGMDLDTARSAVDWLKSLGCRVIPLMGGEPTLRKDFLLDVLQYGSENGFFMYLPTNGYLLDKPFIDELGKTGVAAINLAVDCIAPRRGLPKALLNIEPQFRYLVERQKKYGYILFFNINICRNNIKDVRMLTEIAHQNRIGTDYHLNEPPHHFVDVDHYTHQDDMLSVTEKEWEEVDRLLDWLIEKHREGWPMVNSIAHLREFKLRMRGRMQPWDCRAGHNGALIRTDGTLSPCFDLITYEHDWGRIGNPKFDKKELEEVKKNCLPNCSSTCYHTMASYYSMRSLPQWIGKHVRIG